MVCDDYPEDRDVRYRVTKISYVLDDMAGDPILNHKPNGFR
jgi:hypothetical protein